GQDAARCARPGAMGEASMNALRSLALAAALTLSATAMPARAQSSELSALSLLPVAVSVAAPGMIFSAGVTLTVVAVEASAVGTVWVLERASDGARATVRWSARAAGAASVAVGTAVVVTAVSTGWVLSAASEAIAFIPNEVGAALLYNERITQ